MRMSQRAIKTIRHSTEQWMIDEIEIWRPGEQVLDSQTNVTTYSEGTKVYEGKARVKRTGGAQSANIGEGEIAMMSADFLIPHDAPLPWKDDKVLGVSLADPELQGQWFVITNVLFGGQQASRSFSATTDQASRLHNPDERYA